MHVPVMLRECLEYLAIRPDGVYLDATCGLGGHTRAIAAAIARQLGSGFVIACDRDAESLALAAANTLVNPAEMAIGPAGASLEAARLSEPRRIRFHHVSFSLVGTALQA